MTLNAIIKRINGICTAHKQLRNFYYGLPTDFLQDQKTLYASAFLQDSSGSLAIGQDTIAFKLYILDLVHVSEDTKSNVAESRANIPPNRRTNYSNTRHAELIKSIYGRH